MAEKTKKRVRWFWEKEPDESARIHKPLGLSVSAPSAAGAKMSETDKELVVRVGLPGFKKDEIKLVVTSNTFELTAEKKHEEIERGETFYRRAVARKAVHRAFTLPVAVDADRVSAKLEEGVLTVTMPKLEAEKKRKKAAEIE